MGPGLQLKSLKRFAKRLSVSSPSSSSSHPQRQVGHDELNPLPPAYEDVPVFAQRPAQIPFLPYEIITEIISWAITPAFDEYRQHDSAIHVRTLHNLSAVSPAFLSIVRRICRESPQIPESHRHIPCRDSHTSTVCTFETAAAWMPISVLAGIFQLNIFDKKDGKSIARVQGFQPNLTALIFLLWNRQAMERVEGVPRTGIYLPYPVPFATHNHHRSINKFNIVLKALANCRHLQFSYVRLSVPALHCDAGHLLAAIRTIAPTRYLEVNMHILGWGGGEEHPGLPGFWAKLPLQILEAGLRRGASRVDIHDFRLDDRPAGERVKEMGCAGSLVNFIRARTIPEGVITIPPPPPSDSSPGGVCKREGGGGVFAQLIIKGDLDFTVGVSTGASHNGKLSGKSLLKGMMTMAAMENKVVVSPFIYYLTAVRDGELEWMGDGEKFAAKHFLELALKDGEGEGGTVERRRIEEGWREL
ncbi:hypothetical protein TWF481_010198 [Arthrobotrys musiformis]|uniref:F-box domain-containing protein n=1 Tax=Arthrobotrys musiformis TaxID=47236 RepID=A0AAV9W051_9PEZI